MATATKKGFVRVVLFDIATDTNQNINYDSEIISQVQCMKILDEYKIAKNEEKIFDLALKSGAHIFLDSKEIKMAWFVPESFMNNDEHKH
jgi:hypothetical protein